MFSKFFSFMHSDVGLKVLAAAVAVAAVVKNSFPPHTVAVQVANHVIEIGVVLGVSSSSARAPKA